VGDQAVLVLEHAVRRQKTEHSIERRAVRPGRRRQGDRVLRRVVKGIGHAKVGDGVQATRHAVAAGHL
jgi:hypothetical protein